MTDQLSTWMESHVSRRGFLGRGGKLAAAVGLGLLGGAVVAESARADQFCCTGAGICNGCPPTVGQCPSGWSYDGYTWVCCDGLRHRAARCWDCTKGSSLCICNLLTGDVC